MNLISLGILIAWNKSQKIFFFPRKKLLEYIIIITYYPTTKWIVSYKILTSTQIFDANLREDHKF